MKYLAGIITLLFQALANGTPFGGAKTGARAVGEFADIRCGYL